MKGKKILAVTLSAALAASSLAACGSSDSSSDTTSATSSSASGSTTGLGGDVSDQTYYMVTFMSGYSFWSECWRGFQDAAEVFGVNALYGGAEEYDINEAVTALQQIAATEPDAMAVTAMDADAYVDPINEIIDSGIPVVMFDSDSPDSNRSTFLGTSNYDCGVSAAEYIGEAMGGEGTVISCTSLSQTNIYARQQGFEATMAELYPDIEIVVVDAATDTSQAVTDVSSALTTNSDTTWIFAQTQATVLASETALSETGMADDVQILGFDTDETTLDSIDNGTVAATITQSPYLEGYWSLIYCYFLVNQDLYSGTDDWYAQGYPALPATGDSGSMIVTADNTYMFRVTDSE